MDIVMTNHTPKLNKRYRVTIKSNNIVYTSYVIDADNEEDATSEYYRLDNDDELPEGKTGEFVVIHNDIYTIEEV
jgi:hypothetical protein